MIFHETLNKLFDDTLLHREQFLRWLAKKLDLRPYRFIANVAKWQNTGLVEQRGRNSSIENCIVSTNERNRRNIVQLSKKEVY